MSISDIEIYLSIDEYYASFRLADNPGVDAIFVNTSALLGTDLGTLPKCRLLVSVVHGRNFRLARDPPRSHP